MLKNEIPNVDLLRERNNLQHLLPEEVQPYFAANPEKIYDFPIFPFYIIPKK